MQIFRPKTSKISSSDSGFSLLEMLIVLAIMGIMLSLVSVRLANSLDSTEFIKTSENAIKDIRLIRLRAIIDMKEVEIHPSDPNKNSPSQENNPRKTIRALDLPSGWTVNGDIIYISKTGMCSGGTLSIKDDSGRQATFYMPSPKCIGERIPLPETRSDM